MREAMSLLLATSILGLGGLGLYFCKPDNQKGGEDYDEDVGLNENENIDYENEEQFEDYEVKPKKRIGGKTKRSRKGLGTKRRY